MSNLQCKMIDQQYKVGRKAKEQAILYSELDETVSYNPFELKYPPIPG